MDGATLVEPSAGAAWVRVGGGGGQEGSPRGRRGLWRQAAQRRQVTKLGFIRLTIIGLKKGGGV